jgi:hypothetical protein
VKAYLGVILVPKAIHLGVIVPKALTMNHPKKATAVGEDAPNRGTLNLLESLNWKKQYRKHEKDSETKTHSSSFLLIKP